MDPYDFVHLALFAIGGEVKGKTKLQKTVFFLGIMTNHLDDLGYRPHFYGPYSNDVAEAIGRLKAIGFVDQNIVGGGSMDERGFERRRYDYRLSDDGRMIAEAKKKKYPAFWERIQEAAKVLADADNLNYMKLSIAAKTYFLLGKNRDAATDKELAGLASRFGWSVTSSEVQEAAHYLEKLGLVKLVEN
ncbi:MAG: hypothetical protein ABII12_07360 [Planctomycetota bacterium]